MTVEAGYFANAAAGLMPPEVLAATTHHLRREAEIGAAGAAAEAGTIVADGYRAVADLIGADPDEVAFVESGNRALAALVQSAGLKAGDHVLVDRTCWGGTLDMLTSYPGVVVDVMPVDADGRVDVEEARRQAHPATKLIVLTWCPATCGILHPAETVGNLAHDLGAFYIVDACQVLGQQPVDVSRLRCHGLAASGRKWLRGPRGTAILFASRRYLDATAPFMPDQFGRRRSDARRYETGEAFVAGRVGLSVAVQTLLKAGTDVTSKRLADIAQQIRVRSGNLPGVSICERGPALASFVTLAVAGSTAERVATELAARGISVSVPDRIYAPLDMDARDLASVVRIAPHLFTTASAVDTLVAALADIAGAPA